MANRDIEFQEPEALVVAGDPADLAKALERAIKVLELSRAASEAASEAMFAAQASSTQALNAQIAAATSAQGYQLALDELVQAIEREGKVGYQGSSKESRARSIAQWLSKVSKLGRGERREGISLIATMLTPAVLAGGCAIIPGGLIFAPMVLVVCLALGAAYLGFVLKLRRHDAQA